MVAYINQGREARLRDEIIRVCRLVYAKGFVAATDGNVSARLDADHILATPSGFSKGFIEAGELIVVDMDGRPIDDYRHRGAKGLTVTSEILLHLEVYRQRPDAGAVVHAHPPKTVALSIAGIPIARCLLPEVLVTLGDIPVTDYATPASAEGPLAIRPYIADHDALVLQRHGSVTLGHDPFEAYLKLEKVEHAAEITLILRQLGVDAPIPPAEAARLLDVRRQKGLPVGEELVGVCHGCGACGRKAPADADEVTRRVTERVLAALR